MDPCATCFSSAEASSAQSWVIQRIVDSGTNPHCGARLLLRAGATRRRRRTLRRPPLVPAVMPRGPLSSEDTLEIENGAIDPPVDYALTTIDAAASKWVASARAHWSRLAGRDLGVDDRSRFVWRQTQTTQTQPYDAATFRAATWRSLGRLAAQAAAAMRRSDARADSSLRNRIAWKFLNAANIVQEKDHDDEQDDRESLAAAGREPPGEPMQVDNWITQAAAATNALARGDSSHGIPFSRLSALALKEAYRLDDIARIERAAAFKSQFDQSAVHLGAGRGKTPGSAAYRYVRGP